MLPNEVTQDDRAPMIRDYYVNLTTMNDIVCSLFGTQLYSTVSEHTGVHAMFAFFALNGLACALFSYYVVFETKGRTFSEIQKILNSSSNK